MSLPQLSLSSREYWVQSLILNHITWTGTETFEVISYYPHLEVTSTAAVNAV